MPHTNPELQSAMVRIALWAFGVAYVGLGAITGYYRVDAGYYVGLFSAYLVLFLALLASVLVRPVWVARQYVALALDVTAVSLAIFLTKEAISPFYLFYIWIFISSATRYGRRHLIVASALSVVAYSTVLVVLQQWQRHTFEAVFFLLLLVLLPLYQHSLLRQVQEARREAELANKAKGDFLAVMTHELRTPLTGVVGMTHLLQSTALSAEQRGYLDSIASSAEVLRALIGDVLDLSKIDAGKMHLESVRFDLRSTLKDVCASLGNQALAKGLDLILQCDPRLPMQVTGDQLRVRQILFNLVGNAVKFTDRGTVRVRASIRPPEGDVPGDRVLLEVEDTGIGIPREKIDEIFEGFRQADDSTTRRYGGTGLGTTIARDLTRLMGGRIGVDSVEGQGSRFWVRLPLLQDAGVAGVATGTDRLAGPWESVFETSKTSRDLGGARPALPEGQPGDVAGPQAAPSLSVERGRILVAEDNEIAARVISALLGKQGLAVTLVGDGTAALEMARAERFALALVDLRMPKLDGIAFTRAYRATERVGEHLPIVALTANATEDIRAQCLAAGMDDFLGKPVGPRDLVEIVARYIKPAV